MRRLTLPESVNHWSLRSVQTKLIKTGGLFVRLLPIERQFTTPPDGFLSLMGRLKALVSDTTMAFVEDAV